MIKNNYRFKMDLLKAYPNFATIQYPIQLGIMTKFIQNFDWISQARGYCIHDQRLANFQNQKSGIGELNFLNKFLWCQLIIQTKYKLESALKLSKNRVTKPWSKPATWSSSLSILEDCFWISVLYLYYIFVKVC